MGPGSGSGTGALSGQAEALLTLRHLCREYKALPSQVMAEDGGLLLQLLEADGIITVAEAEAAKGLVPPEGGAEFDESLLWDMEVIDDGSR